jgi:hypothetical protein
MKLGDLVAHPVALAKTWRGRFILAFVVVQLLLPLAYFARRDPHDERFAWRMFSPMRMAQCKASFAVDGAPIALADKFHEAWLTLVERGRFVVVEAMAARLCDEHPNKTVTVRLDCSYLDREQATYGGHDMCRAPEL